MELVWFNWKTNLDYADLLLRKEVRTSTQIKKSEMKRILARHKRIARAGIKFPRKR